MSYTIEVVDLAFEELLAVKPFYRNQVIDRIEEQLTFEPTVETRNRKVLTGLKPDFEHGDPVWELRVRDYRVYYDVNEQAKSVIVRSVRKKPPHTATEQIT